MIRFGSRTVACFGVLTFCRIEALADQAAVDSTVERKGKHRDARESAESAIWLSPLPARVHGGIFRATTSWVKHPELPPPESGLPPGSESRIR